MRSRMCEDIHAVHRTTKYSLYINSLGSLGRNGGYLLNQNWGCSISDDFKDIA